MLRKRNLLTTLLIVLPWALLLTLWHQYPATRYLILLRKETDENVTAKDLFNSTSPRREEGLQSCNWQQASGVAPKVIQNYVYSRPPPWSETLPTIFVITPTYTRPVQKAELTRLANTFLHVQNLHWVVVEDSPRKTNLVSNLLEKAGLKFTHLNVESPASLKMGGPWIPSHKPRGTLQRNLGLHWLRDSFNSTQPPEGVVYFADDDNTYSLELFEEMRYTRRVSVWPVAFAGGLRYESPIVSPAGKVVGWKVVFDPNRPFAIDMAGFAVSIRLILEKPQATFKLEGVKGGYQESSLLKDLVTMDGLEPKAANCTKVLVWHTKTERPMLVGPLTITFNVFPSERMIIKKNPFVQFGGSYSPPHCLARYKSAIIIPHKDQEKPLRHLLYYLHPFLQRQQLHYSIYLIQQAGNATFNRAKLLNVGVREAMKDEDWDCLLLHDVNLIPENDYNLYVCDEYYPKHIASALDKFQYSLPYWSFFGGVCALTPEHYMKINGFPNTYWGNRGEDDDIAARIQLSGMKIVRTPVHLGRYKMVDLEQHPGSEEYLRRPAPLYNTRNTWKDDGMNSVEFTLLSRKKHFLYTNITVDIGNAPTLLPEDKDKRP